MRVHVGGSVLVRSTNFIELGKCFGLFFENLLRIIVVVEDQIT